LKNKPDESWQLPANIEKANVCGKEDYFINGTEKKCGLPATITDTNTGG